MPQGYVPEHLIPSPLDPAALLAAAARPEHGAMVLFAGVVRHQDGDRAITALDYSTYPPLARATLAHIESEVGAAHRAAVHIRHRLGRVPAGEVSVLVLATSAHRDAAQVACREALERLKREVPIWKHELAADGSRRWHEVEPLPLDGSTEPET